MPTRLLVLADTHVPARARDLPPEVWEAVDSADVVVHAGDWVDEAFLDVLLARLADGRGRPGGAPGALVGVAGNNDGSALHARLGLVARVRIEGVALAVVHESGPAAGREARCAARFGDADVLVFGHSHIPWDASATRPDGGGLRLLNPGSPTDRRRQSHATYLTAVVTDAALHGVVLHELPVRAHARARRG